MGTLKQRQPYMREGVWRVAFLGLVSRDAKRKATLPGLHLFGHIPTFGAAIQDSEGPPAWLNRRPLVCKFQPMARASHSVRNGLHYCGWTKSCLKPCLKPWFVGIHWGIVIPGINRWCRISSIHSMTGKHVPRTIQGFHQAIPSATGTKPAKGHGFATRVHGKRRVRSPQVL